jgi:hypothetical protein
MKHQLRSQDWYLSDPRLKKWIVRCVACEAYGRKPNYPRTIPKANFEANFPEMELDEHGMCPACAEILISPDP